MIDYAEKTSGVTLTIDGQANDGTSGGAEGDNIPSDVEELRATAHGDSVSAAGHNTGVRIYTFEGDDLLLGSEAGDLLDAGAGTDTLQGRGGADDLNGGDGWDKADYADKTSGVNLTMDGQANDGTSNGAEGDHVRNDIEELRTTAHNDVMSTVGRAQQTSTRLYGFEGNDKFISGLSDDDFVGGDGTSDEVSYQGHSRVRVSLDGQGNDGWQFVGPLAPGEVNPSERDNVRQDIEVLVGSDNGD